MIGAFIGSLVGLLAGYFGALIDAALSFLINEQLSFPFTLLDIFLLATFGGGFLSVVVVVALATWVNYARVVRGQVMSVKNQEYVEAAISVGVPTQTILRRYILPNLLSSIIVVVGGVAIFYATARSVFQFQQCSLVGYVVLIAILTIIAAMIAFCAVLSVKRRAPEILERFMS